MNDIKLKFEKSFINTAKLILLIIGIDVVISSLLFVIGISITRANLVIACVVALCIYKFLYKCEKQEILEMLLLTIIIFFISILINANLYELAYDGNLYHKFATGIFKLGYNPFYDRVENYLKLLQIPNESWYCNDVWVECYPKASWIFDSSVYVWINWIEASKIFNILIMISCIGISIDYFKEKLKKSNALIISLIFSITPTSLAMVFSFYLDGALGNLLLISIVLLLSITDNDYRNDDKLQFFMLALSIILCGNLKISGLGFEAVFCAAFFFWWVIRRKELGFETKIIKIVVFYIVTVGIAVFVVGWGTYINNIINYGNLLYPMGMEGFDIANNLKSVGLENAKPIVQMFCMIFVRTTTFDKTPYLEWKVPFSVDFTQIKHSTYDVIRGGAGIFYSGILIVGIFIYMYLLIKENGKKSFDKTAINLIIFVSVLLLMFIPAGGQVRYSPYVFYFVNFTIYYFMIYIEKRPKECKAKNMVLFTMIILQLINVVPFTNYYFRFIQQKPIEEMAYSEMEENKNGVYINTKLPGLVFNLIDRNIKYEYRIEEKLDNHLDYLEFDYEMKE